MLSYNVRSTATPFIYKLIVYRFYCFPNSILETNCIREHCNKYVLNLMLQVSLLIQIFISPTCRKGAIYPNPFHYMNMKVFVSSLKSFWVILYPIT